MPVRLQNNPRRGDVNYTDRVRWVIAYNPGLEVIPSHAVCRVVDAVDGIIHVGKPNADGQDVLVNSATPIPSLGYGSVTRETPIQSLYNLADGTPVPGETWGAGAGVWDLRKGNPGFLIAGGASASTETTTILRATVEPCIVPVSMRIDGGNATTGYDFTTMRQTSADPSLWEEDPDGYNSTDLGYKAFEVNGVTVTAGVTIYSGEIDLCRDKAFFFGSDAPGLAIVEYLEPSPSKGDLYAARIFIRTFNTAGIDTWTAGDYVWAEPINPTIPTLETLYFARRSPNKEIVDSKACYETDRCCDAVRETSSSGSGTNCSCADLTLTTATVNYSSTTKAFSLTESAFGNSWSSSGILTVGATDFNVNIAITCVDVTPGVISVVSYYTMYYRNMDGTNGALVFPSITGNAKGCGDSLVWNDGSFSTYGVTLSVS